MPTRARLLVAGVAVALLLTVAPLAGAVTGKIVVSPTAPATGGKAQITVQLPTTAKQLSGLYVNVVSPQGFVFRVRLARAGAHTWRTGMSFARAGRWKLNVFESKGGLVGRTSVVVRTHA
jgi:hypothetical protein